MSIYGETYRKRGKTFIKGVSGVPFCLTGKEMTFDADCVDLQSLNGLWVLVSSSGTNYSGNTAEEAFDKMESLERNHIKNRKRATTDGVVTFFAFSAIFSAFYFLPIGDFLIWLWSILKYVLFGVFTIFLAYSLLSSVLRTSYLVYLGNLIICGFVWLCLFYSVSFSHKKTELNTILPENEIQTINEKIRLDQDVVDLVGSDSDDPLNDIFEHMFDKSWEEAILKRSSIAYNSYVRADYRENLMDTIWRTRVQYLKSCLEKGEVLDYRNGLDYLLKPLPMPWEI